MTKKWINIHRHLFGAFLETHIQPISSRRISSAIPICWKKFGNFGHHHTSRIILVWDPSISLVVYKVSTPAITCGIFVQAENVSTTVTFVYGHNVVEERLSLWEELVFLKGTTPIAKHPWAIVGDFNHIIRITQHSTHQRKNIDTSGMDDFNMALQDSEVFEAQAKGLSYSW